MNWTTSCADWSDRIVRGASLIPFEPLFPKEAAEALEVFKSLTIADAVGSPSIGEACLPWVTDFAASIFGAYDAATGRRHVREFLLLVSKKNSKSTLAAGIMLTALIRNWRKSAQFLIIAPTIEIADNSFKPVADMVRANEELSKLLHVQPNFRLITHRITGATLKVVAADNETVSGKKATGVFIDELWLFGKRANAENMIREAVGGLVSRPEGFVIYASTQSDAAPTGIFKKKLDYFRGVRDGKIKDPKSLGVIYEFPGPMIEEKAYLDPENFYVTNPNLGISVDRQWLVEELEKAKIGGPESMVGFAAKHLNIEITQGLRSDGWSGAKHWADGAEKGLTLSEVIRRSEVLTVGSDGGGTEDLFGVFVLGREKGTGVWLGWAHAFISPQGWERRKANQTVYQDFITDGDLTLIERMPDDITAVVDIVKQCLDSGKLAKVGADPAGIGTLVDELAKIGVTTRENGTGMLVGVRQGVALMGAIKTMERKLIDGTFKHGGRRMMAWCAGNAITEQTGTGMRIARDLSGYGKIDPLVAGFMCFAEMMLNPKPENGVSCYETRDLMVV
jgi:phage terminase large subunit-like protein